MFKFSQRESRMSRKALVESDPTHPGGAGRGRTVVRRLALVLISSALALGAGELVLRLRDAAPAVSRLAHGRYRLSPNPRLGYEPVPARIAAASTGPLEDFVGTSNSLGFRDREHAPSKPPGVKRVVVLGDSVGAGLKVAMTRDVFPAVMERLLVESGRPVEVINLSVHGYDTQQEIEMLIERGLQFSPDVVLVAYTLSDRERLDGDILETLLRARYDPAVASPSWRDQPWVVRSALGRALAFRLFPRRAAPADPATEATIAQALAQVSGDTVAPSFARLRELADRHHFRVLVAVFPYLVRDAESYPYLKEHTSVRRLSRAEGFDHRDLLGPLRSCGGVKSLEAVRADWAHLNVRGHACTARVLADALASILDDRESPVRGKGSLGNAVSEQ